MHKLWKTTTWWYQTQFFPKPFHQKHVFASSDRLPRPRYASSVGTEDQEIVERSEGGYRTKRKVIPGTAPEPRKESKPGCLSKCCLAKKYELMIVEYCKIAHTYKQQYQQIQSFCTQLGKNIWWIIWCQPDAWIDVTGFGSTALGVPWGAPRVMNSAIGHELSDRYQSTKGLPLLA